jgi:hypothetical protein
MSSSNFATYPRSGSDGTYGENLARAARGFLVALLAAQPAPRVLEKKSESSATRATTADLRRLYRLARGSDSVNPKAVTELSAIAGKSRD